MAGHTTELLRALRCFPLRYLYQPTAPAVVGLARSCFTSTPLLTLPFSTQERLPDNGAGSGLFGRSAGPTAGRAEAGDAGEWMGSGGGVACWESLKSYRVCVLGGSLQVWVIWHARAVVHGCVHMSGVRGRAALEIRAPCGILNDLFPPPPRHSPVWFCDPSRRNAHRAGRGQRQHGVGARAEGA